MYKVFKLENGLQIVCEKIDGVNSVSLGVMVKNGSRDEDESLNGISHFIEHMFFKGTDRRSFKDITSSIENIGGQINAFTGRETTCYFVKVLGSHLDLGLDVISDILLNSKFDKEEIEKEKGVVCEEINMSLDSPEEVLEDLRSTVIYGNTSLARPILGTSEKVKSFTREDIIKYIEKRYVPTNSVVSICGKIDLDEIENMISKYFGKWVALEGLGEKNKEVLIEAGSDYRNREIEQLHINIGYRGLPYNHPRSYALVLINNILGGGASSRLFHKVREELGLCYSVYTYLDSFEGVGTINVYVGLNKNSAIKALEVIKETVDCLVKEGITEEELEINKEKLKGTFILGQESTSSKMFANAKSLLFRGEIRSEEEVLEKISSITMDDINFVLENCFGEGALNSTFVGPLIDKEELNKYIFN